MQTSAKNGTVHERVKRRAGERRSALAVRQGTRSLTYGELEESAERLAATLRARGVIAESVVALCLNRSIELVIAQYAILKAGGAFLTIDPEAPSERVRYMAVDAKVACVVTQRAYYDRLQCLHDLAIVEVDGPPHAGARDEQVGGDLRPDNLAYVNYTSGSTGRPKGVAVTHAGLANLIDWHVRQFEIRSDDRASVVAGLGFDALVWEIWPYLSVGATIHLADDRDRLSAEHMRDWIVAERITVAFLPTPVAESAFRLSWPTPSTLRLLVTGGSKVHSFPPRSLPFPVVNVYGLAETSVIATWGVIPATDSPPAEPPSIGTAIDKVDALVIDERMASAQPGEAGELYIAGVALARGYLGRPGLTAERFVPDCVGSVPGRRLYKTGDRAFCGRNGALHFIGRLDDQVKIRGTRVELGEVEAALRRLPGVADAVVAVKGLPSGEEHLVAYLVPGLPASPQQLREALADALLPAMIPGRFVALANVPLTTYGKIDRAALPDPPPAESTGAIEFSNAAEEVLASIWCEILKVSSVGPEDNFFELGGDSITAIQVVTRARAAGLRLSNKDVFALPTIAELARMQSAAPVAERERQSAAAAHSTIKSTP